MEGVLPSILCCNCGITIEQNPSNMCISCIRDNVDITAEIAKKMTIHTCRTCKRWDGDVNHDYDDDGVVSISDDVALWYRFLWCLYRQIKNYTSMYLYNTFSRIHILSHHLIIHVLSHIIIIIDIQLDGWHHLGRRCN